MASEPLALVLFGALEHRLRGVVVVENCLLKGLRQFSLEGHHESSLEGLRQCLPKHVLGPFLASLLI